MRAVTAATTIKTPPVIDLADAQHLSMSSTTCFRVRDLLAGVLGNLMSFFEWDGGEAAFTVNRRRLDC